MNRIIELRYGENRSIIILSDCSVLGIGETIVVTCPDMNINQSIKFISKNFPELGKWDIVHMSLYELRNLLKLGELKDSDRASFRYYLVSKFCRYIHDYDAITEVIGSPINLYLSKFLIKKYEYI